MKKKVVSTAIYLLVCNISVSASGNRDLKNLYHSLDSMIQQQHQLVRNKEQKIDGMRKALTQGTSEMEKYQINKRIYDEYAAFKYDSAYAYAERNVDLAKQMDNTKLYNVSLMDKSHILSVAGLFDETEKVLGQIDTSGFDSNELIDYYNIFDDLLIYKAEFSNGTIYASQYVEEMSNYRKKILETATPGTYDYVITKSALDCKNGNMHEAIKLLADYLPALEPGTRRYSIMTSTLAFYYGINKDSTLQKKYFILSAMSDLKGCIRETNSLRVLSSLLFSEGDIDRAYNYLNVCINDANFYGARLRNIQAGQLMPYVVSAYQREQTAHSHLMASLLVISVVFIVLLIAGIIFISLLMKRYNKANNKIHKMNQKLNDMVEQLKKTNEQQRMTNHGMKESNKIKEEYIGRFLKLSSSYIEVYDTQRKMLNRLAMNHKLPELYDELKSNRIETESVERFYQNFDSAFLNIYPDFVNEVNKLLKPENQIVPKEGEQLTTELRVFALIRLGITNNQEIASILRSSITTVYTYRSKMKNKSTVKDNFEKRVSEIDSYIDEKSGI